MKQWFYIFVCCFISIGLSGQTSLEGRISDSETQEPIIGGSISLFLNGVLTTGTVTDIDGNYTLSNIDPGTYDVEVSYVGYSTQRQTGVILYAGKATRLDIEISAGLALDEVVVVEYAVPLIEQDNTTSGGIVTSEKIRNLPTKSINQLAATTAGISSIDGGAISVRGSRSNATDYYIDGIRVTSNLIPQTEIDQLQVITGGIEAKYGDVTGGIISITTKGPSSQFSGGLEIETSEVLDPYGYNLLNANLSGPILKNKEGNSILGFRLAGQYLLRQDDDPPAFGSYAVSPQKIAELEENPITFLQGTPISSAEFLQDGDAQLYSANLNERNERLDITGKIDARLTKNIDMTLSGSFRNAENQFTPGGWGLLNYENNPIFYSGAYRGNLRFRHRIGGSPLEQEGNTGFIRNASYILQGGYERSYSRTEDLRHQDRLFDYGHIGRFDVSWIPVAGESDYSGSPIPGVAHAGYLQVLEGYEPGMRNPVLANYNKGINPSDLLRV